jgi:hypothetical protein
MIKAKPASRKVRVRATADAQRNDLDFSACRGALRLRGTALSMYRSTGLSIYLILLSFKTPPTKPTR